MKRKCSDDSEIVPPEKQTRTLDSLGQPFTVGGKCEDEIELKFDDKNLLFVSESFLILASPVFEAMFSNDFAEKRARHVRLPGKRYEDFLEFLLCMNPGCLHEVNESNVLCIAPLAEEYQVSSVVAKCKQMMIHFIRKEFLEAVREQSAMTLRHKYTEKQLIAMRSCLKVLQTATTLNYQHITEYCIKVAAGFSSGLYGEINSPFSAPEDYPSLHKECKELFESLSAEVRCKILSKRLFFRDSYELIDPLKIIN